MTAVEVANLSVCYGPLRAVDDVSFTASFGEVTAVLGPNGAGKTSTIETCEGFRPPTSGTVRVLGLDPWAQRTTLHREIGVMLQEGGVYPSARVGETVAQYCRLYDRGMSPTELIDRVGLRDRSTATWRRLSGGEKQRLSLALALAANPRVAFLDEPTSGVDVNGRDDVREIIRRLAADGCAVILATHELDEAERLADRVVLFNRGRIVANSTLANLRSTRTTVRFRSSTSLDAAALSRHIGLDVSASGDEFAIGFSSTDASMASDLVSRISVWLGSNSLPLHDLNVGGERLEDIFRMLTKGDES
ncbi:MAG: ABC transporter ATP-binding protein [Ilumatobacteraceae bacterium]|nr:ABC transporter ATP-binding protein [Ilumatobacteraceae bacterium]